MQQQAPIQHHVPYQCDSTMPASLTLLSLLCCLVLLLCPAAAPLRHRSAQPSS
jgi:hypothetical protein